MKLTKSKLRQIIKETLGTTLGISLDDWGGRITKADGSRLKPSDLAFAEEQGFETSEEAYAEDIREYDPEDGIPTLEQWRFHQWEQAMMDYEFRAKFGR